MDVGNPECVKCSVGTENVDHLFLNCRHARRKWEDLEYLQQREAGRSDLGETSLVFLVEKMLAPDNLATLLCFVVSTRQIWRDRYPNFEVAATEDRRTNREDVREGHGERERGRSRDLGRSSRTLGDEELEMGENWRTIEELALLGFREIRIENT
ncbi:hypothetical protein R1sor_026339 [Riccia sorocarpa]|uniref:Reverse transcriptase zinc-binding domain-containing protein n=1 Tax=Riccia sorocarpa TaxID=122646 RepID=A0ABD3GES6_9MARC